MAKEKSRKEKLSIYLVKNNELEAKYIVKTENSKSPIAVETNQVSGMLFVKKDPPKPPPPWTKFFSDSIELPNDLFGKSQSVGALYIAKYKESQFVLTFGSGFHLLKNETIERDFGLRVTLNSVIPDKLRSLDKASYDHNPLNSRTQSSIDLDVFDLDIDSEMDLLYAITGVSKYEIFGTHITGRDALTLLLDTSLKNLNEILEEALIRYQAPLPAEFEWVDNIKKVKDKEALEVLDLELDGNLTNYEKENIWLGEPEIIDWETQIGYSFDIYPKTPRHVVLQIEELHKYLDLKGMTLDTATLKMQSVHINNSEYQSTKRWPAYRCLYAEIKVGKEEYILRNGVWYQVNRGFIEGIDKFLSNLPPYKYDFPIYNHDREEDYNSHVEEIDKTIELMDKKMIKVGGPYDKIEFCDLIRNGTDFIHVKYYRSSASLSHLFSQGFVASEAFVRDVDFREKLNLKLPASVKLDDIEIRPNPNDYTVVYAIATNKNLPSELPFFSKVTLKNALQSLNALNYNVRLIALKVDPALEAKKKGKPEAKKKLA